jgi:CRP-like cAMP-binding protein
MNKFFKGLSEEEINLVLKFFDEVEYSAGEFIVREEEYSDMAFILKEGEVEIIKITIYKDDYVIDTIKAPSDNIFGEINLIDKGKVTSTIKAKSDVVILRITHDNFKNLTNEYPSIGIKIFWTIAEDLANHLRKADKDIITLFNALVETIEND